MADPVEHLLAAFWRTQHVLDMPLPTEITNSVFVEELMAIPHADPISYKNAIIKLGVLFRYDRDFMREVLTAPETRHPPGLALIHAAAMLDVIGEFHQMALEAGTIAGDKIAGATLIRVHRALDRILAIYHYGYKRSRSQFLPSGAEDDLFTPELFEQIFGALIVYNVLYNTRFGRSAKDMVTRGVDRIYVSLSSTLYAYKLLFSFTGFISYVVLMELLIEWQARTTVAEGPGNALWKAGVWGIADLYTPESAPPPIPTWAEYLVTGWSQHVGFGLIARQSIAMRLYESGPRVLVTAAIKVAAITGGAVGGLGVGFLWKIATSYPRATLVGVLATIGLHAVGSREYRQELAESAIVQAEMQKIEQTREQIAVSLVPIRDVLAAWAVVLGIPLPVDPESDEPEPNAESNERPQADYTNALPVARIVPDHLAGTATGTLYAFSHLPLAIGVAPPLQRKGHAGVASLVGKWRLLQSLYPQWNELTADYKLLTLYSPDMIAVIAIAHIQLHAACIIYARIAARSPGPALTELHAGLDAVLAAHRGLAPPDRIIAPDRIVAPARITSDANIGRLVYEVSTKVGSWATPIHALGLIRITEALFAMQVSFQPPGLPKLVEHPSNAIFAQATQPFQDACIATRENSDHWLLSLAHRYSNLGGVPPPITPLGATPPKC